MSLRLILMRHAKSGWDDPMADDHERELNARGRQDAPRIGQWLAARGYVPDAALCSNATRTAETLRLVLTKLPVQPRISYRADMYHASPASLLDALHQGTGQTLLMVGHNPGIGSFAREMLDQPPGHARFADYPTAATTVMAFDGPTWNEAAPGQGRLLDFVTPHDLT